MNIFQKILLLLALFATGTLATIPANAAPKSKKTNTKVIVADDTENELYDGKENLPGENFSAAWPTLTRIPDMLPARTVQDGPDTWIYETQHFRFTSNAPIALGAIKEIARIFEGTYAANLALPINSPCNHFQVCEKGKFNAFLFRTYEDYLAAGALEGSAGVFIGTNAGLASGRVLVPFASLGLEKRGNRYVKGGKRVNGHTLAHEITHHMSIGSYTYPTWFVEGLAEYVGLSYDGNGQVRFSGNKTPISKFVAGYGEKGGGGRAIGKQPQVGMSLQEFLNYKGLFVGSDSVQIGYGVSALLVYYFFHLDGKRDAARIKKYLAVLQNGGSFEQANEELLGGRTWAQLEKDICRRLKSVMKVEPKFASGER
ncbi:MAG: hypothetical protein E7037_00260 [Verrucomicrobia bacterium]|nr:hypothetical protein [Verrucomicrobiota bacterium]